MKFIKDTEAWEKWTQDNFDLWAENVASPKSYPLFAVVVDLQNSPDGDVWRAASYTYPGDVLEMAERLKENEKETFNYSFGEKINDLVGWAYWRSQNLFAMDDIEKPKRYPCFVYPKVGESYQFVGVEFIYAEDAKKMAEQLTA